MNDGKKRPAANVVDLNARRAAKKPRRVRCLTILVKDKPKNSQSNEPERYSSKPTRKAAPSPTVLVDRNAGPYVRYTIEPTQMLGERLFGVYGWKLSEGRETRTLIEQFWKREQAEKKYPNAEIVNQPSA